MVLYSTILDITWFQDRPKNCIKTEVHRLYRKNEHYLDIMVFALDSSSSVVKKLWCVYM